MEFRRGAGSSLEVLYGKVSLTPTLLHTVGTSVVLPAPSTFDLINGVAIATNVAPSPEPVEGKVAWAYVFRITDNYGKTWEYLAGVPDGTTEINFNVLPRYFETKPPLFGQGPQGVPGEAATIEIGTVGATPPGSEPVVTNSGTANDVILNFELPRGEVGPQGVGVPDGGTALQIIRKDSANVTTEWATLDKAIVGLGNVDNTSDADKPVSTLQSTAIADAAVTANSTKTAAAPPSSYPHGTTSTLARTDAGWPEPVTPQTFVVVTTSRAKNNNGGTFQRVVAYNAANSPILYRVARDNDTWDDFQTLATIAGLDSTIATSLQDPLSATGVAANGLFVDRFHSDSGRIGLGDNALGTLPDSYNVGSYASIVAIGRNAMLNMQQVKTSIAIGSNALSQGTISRDNIAIGDDALWATQSLSPDYVQTGRDGTRNVAVGALTGRFNKSGIAHVFMGRGAGASVVSGRGLVAIGSNCHTSSQPIGLSGLIENWANAFDGSAETPTYVVAIGETAAWANSARNITAIGAGSLENNTKGEHNTALGALALQMLGSNSWFNGGTKTAVNKSGSYTQTGTNLSLSITAHGALVGDIVRFRLLDGGAATFAGDYVYATVLTATANNFTVTNPNSMTAEGSATVSDRISSAQVPLAQYNTAVGSRALGKQVEGSGNSALGYGAGAANVSGTNNTFLGYAAGQNLATGSGNVIIGYQSGNFMVDGSPLTGVTGVITLGQFARVSGSNQMQLGSSAVSVYAYGGVQERSDARDKVDVRDTSLGLDFINKLRPVDFRWKYREGSKQGTRFHHGVIAQEVQAVIESSGKDFGGFQDHKVNGGNDVLSIGYTEFVAPLIKAVQQLSLEVESLKGTL